ncbi:MAG: hypothetical protein KJN95_00170 [Gammaproteobacteria bacterium]|nr:hypothetical protein [Gammaproteobacteria bacterium]
MYRLAGFLSKVALISAMLAVSVTYFEFPPIGYEGMVFVSSVGVVLTIGSAILSLALASILFVKRTSPKPVNATVISILSLILAFGYVWSM